MQYIEPNTQAAAVGASPQKCESARIPRVGVFEDRTVFPHTPLSSLKWRRAEKKKEGFKLRWDTDWCSWLVWLLDSTKGKKNSAPHSLPLH